MSRRVTGESDRSRTHGHPRKTAPSAVARVPRRRADSHGATQASTAPASPRDDRRLRTLLDIDPRLDEVVIDDLRTTVVAALTATLYVNDQVDRTRASILYRYASHMRTLHGEFDAGRHLLEEHLIAYWTNACTDLTPRSRDKTLSVLRTIASRRPFVDGLLMRRPPTSAPYPESQWQAFRSAADRLVDQRWSIEAHMLLDLSGEAGLRGAEISRIRGSALAWSGHTVLATVDVPAPNRPRIVPVHGDAARRLAPHVGSDDHLLRPHYRNRKNAVSSLVTRLAIRDGTFADFRAAAARHRWIARLLTCPIAHLDLVYLAGLERDSHTLHDISTHLPPATSEHAANALLLARIAATSPRPDQNGAPAPGAHDDPHTNDSRERARR